MMQVVVQSGFHWILREQKVVEKIQTMMSTRINHQHLQKLLHWVPRGQGHPLTGRAQGACQEIYPLVEGVGVDVEDEVAVVEGDVECQEVNYFIVSLQDHTCS